jgi:hypothetical protein
MQDTFPMRLPLLFDQWIISWNGHYALLGSLAGTAA